MNLNIAPLHRELEAPVPVPNTSGSNVISGVLFACDGFIVITAPHPWELAALFASNWYIGSIPFWFTFHLVLSNPAVSTIHSPQVANFPPEEDVPVGVAPTSRF